jgi:hypothetical protein
MPVMRQSQDEQAGLVAAKPLRELCSYLGPYPVERMRAYPVALLVRSAAMD